MAKKPEHGAGPIEEQYKSDMEYVARCVDEFLNGDLKGPERPTGFVLLVFPFGDNPAGRCNYLSNGADRKEIVSLFKEMIRRFEGAPEPPTGNA